MFVPRYNSPFIFPVNFQLRIPGKALVHVIFGKSVRPGIQECEVDEYIDFRKMKREKEEEEESKMNRIFEE